MCVSRKKEKANAHRHSGMIHSRPNNKKVYEKRIRNLPCPSFFFFLTSSPGHESISKYPEIPSCGIKDMRKMMIKNESDNDNDKQNLNADSLYP